MTQLFNNPEFVTAIIALIVALTGLVKVIADGAETKVAAKSANEAATKTQAAVTNGTMTKVVQDAIDAYFTQQASNPASTFAQLHAQLHSQDTTEHKP